MLRIDETSKTLVAPQATEYVPEAAPARDELHALISGGWDAFAAEIGHPELTAVGAALEPGIDILAVDEAAGRVAVVIIADGSGAEALGRALSAAAAVASWHADQLGAMHQALRSATAGDSPLLVIVGAAFDDATLAAVDWLVQVHTLEIRVYSIQALRFGSERMMNVVGAYPVAPAPEFVAAVAGAPSVPPPGIPAPPAGIPVPTGA